MRWFRGMAMVLVGIMLLTISGSAFAAVKDDTVSPLYLYTRKVKASLTISDSGKATCVGHIKSDYVVYTGTSYKHYAAMRLNTDETVSTVKVSGVFTPDSK